MNIGARTTNEWNKEISREELLGRLAELKRQADKALPILDDDDLEAALDEAADRIVERMTDSKP